jgi:thiamine pyrophosphokinase
VTIYGGLGHRFDHTFANIHLLWRSHMSNIPCEVIDPYNRVRLIDRPISMEGDFPYVSLIPFTQEVTGVTLTGFKYPLNNAVLRWGMTLGISNQLIAAKGRIDLTEGVLLVIESRDQF